MYAYEVHTGGENACVSQRSFAVETKGDDDMDEEATWTLSWADLSRRLVVSTMVFFIVSDVTVRTVAQDTPAAVPERAVVSIDPQFAAIATEGTQQFKANVRVPSNDAVIWRVNGVVGGNAELGTISENGLYTAPPARPPVRVEITATSVVDPTKVASPNVVVGAPVGTKVWRYGATADSIMANTSGVVAALQNHRRHMTTRLVYDPHIPASQYLSSAQQVAAVSDIMGQPIDSSEVKSKYNVTTYLQRFQDYVPTMDSMTAQWELCNECNGEWLGSIPTVIQEASETYDYLVAQRDQSKTVLTLYYNETCYTNSSNMIWNWIPNLPSRIINGVNTVLLSYWKDQCNGLNPDWQSVMTHLAAVFPNSWVGIGECGKRKWRDQSQIPAYVDLYYPQSGIVTVPSFVGGYYWWYYEENMVPWNSGQTGANSAEMDKDLTP